MAEIEVVVESTSIEVTLAPAAVITVVPSTQIVEVGIATGPPGGDGPEGPPGPPGDPAYAYVSSSPPLLSNPGDFWVQENAPENPAQPGSGVQNVFIGTVAPVEEIPHMWIQTGLGKDGSGFTFWIEDGV